MPFRVSEGETAVFGLASGNEKIQHLGVRLITCRVTHTCHVGLRAAGRERSRDNLLFLII